MPVALILLAALVVVGTILCICDKGPLPVVEEKEDECCGKHLLCDKKPLLEGEVVYYDDEELDAYAGADPATYTDSDVEAFRDVLLTLLPDDIAGWHDSLLRRNIPLPAGMRDELIMMLSE